MSTEQCAICGENDFFVLETCGDGAIRCAHHAKMAGWCWGCGDGDPIPGGDITQDGLCYDCRSEDVMWERKRHAV